MTEERNKISEDRDYVHSKRHGNSMKVLIDEYYHGAPDRIICKALKISPEDLQSIYKSAIMKIGKELT